MSPTAEQYRQALGEIYEDLGKIPASEPGTLSALSSIREKISLAMNPRMVFNGPCGHFVQAAEPGRVIKAECSECKIIYLVENKHNTMEVTQIGRA